MRSLRWRLVTAITLITFGASVVVGIALGRFTEREFRQFLEVEMQVESIEMPDVTPVVERFGAGDLTEARNELARVATAIGERLLLFSTAGELLADSDPAGDSPTYVEGELELVRWREDRGNSAEERVRLRGAATLAGPDGDVGILFVVPRVESAADSRPEVGFTRRVGRARLIGIAVATLLALGVGWLLSRQILEPVGNLTGAARRLAAGDLTQRVEVRSRDEIAQLAESFNSMAASLERQETARRNMVGDVAHELRTPLTHLRCKLESVQDGLATADTKLVDALHGEIVHLSRLVDDLQELALAEAGRLPLHPTLADPGEVVARVVAALPAGDDRPQVTLSGAEDLPRVSIDVDRFRQVLRNLLENAMRHGKPDGRVKVYAAREADALRFTVEDDGPGIAAGHEERIFDRFHRTDPSRDRSTGGAGLGLAISRQLVLAWGGEMGVKNAAGRGAKFWFSVPV
ncbi:MAG: HAMP domain-containing protein [bacterium]|nr:HAMP domain-containing protein [bacterium]